MEHFGQVKVVGSRCMHLTLIPSTTSMGKTGKSPGGVSTFKHQNQPTFGWFATREKWTKLGRVSSCRIPTIFCRQRADPTSINNTNIRREGSNIANIEYWIGANWDFWLQIWHERYVLSNVLSNQSVCRVRGHMVHGYKLRWTHQSLRVWACLRPAGASHIPQTPP